MRGENNAQDSRLAQRTMHCAFLLDVGSQRQEDYRRVS